MILSAQSIRELCQQDHQSLITPFTTRSVIRGKSYGLSSAGYDIRIDKVKASHARQEDDGSWTLRMHHGDFILASSIERIKMPSNLLCIVHDKSSWAREGLCVQNTVLEPGWEGYITLELSLHRPMHSIKLQQGDPIAQLVFHMLDRPTDHPYTGKYQNQEAKPIEAIEERLVDVLE